MKNLRVAAFAVVTALALAACGGDAPPANPPADTTTPATPAAPPPS
ncbi:hypothetical protein [Devosia crocina]|nr:hypothetical protein [Devosia crocina]